MYTHICIYIYIYIYIHTYIHIHAPGLHGAQDGRRGRLPGAEAAADSADCPNN